MADNKYAKNLAKRIKKRKKENTEIGEGIKRILRLEANEIVSKFPSISMIVLSGSIVGGGFSAESDVDIIISGLKKKDYFSLYNLLEKKLNRKIDLIMDEDLSDQDRAHILKNKEIIYDSKKG